MRTGKEERIFRALTDIKDEYIEEAAKTKPVKRTGMRRYMRPLAACLAVVLGIGGILMMSGLLPFGGSGGGFGHDEGDTFMHYEGPVLPLTLIQEDSDISAERNIVYDFSLPREDGLRVRDVRIEDRYILTNESYENKTVELLYPFTGSFQELQEQMPVVSVDGKIVSSRLSAGGYGDEGEKFFRPRGFDDYRSLLEDGSYQKNALSSYPLPDQRVTVYAFSDFEAPSEYPAATYAISFTVDPSKTAVLTYGFEGMEFRESGFRRFSYSVPRKENPSHYSRIKYLIVLGEDIGDYTLKGYKTGSCEEDNLLFGVSAAVTRSEEDLSHVLKVILDDYFRSYGNGELLSVPQDMFYDALSEFFIRSDLLSALYNGNYNFTAMEDILMETKGMQRVFYLRFSATVQGGGRVTVTADYRKKPSHDYSCSRKNNDIQGYDTATRLGSGLAFRKLTAEIVKSENIEIVRQNFGFNLEKGLTKTELDPTVERYYLEIRPKAP
jgi:hypothetical protein